MTDETKGAGEYPHVVQGPEGLRRVGAEHVVWVTGDKTETFKVVSDNAVTSPIVTPKGLPIYWRRVRELRITSGDGSTLTVYGCAECDYVRATGTQVRAHLARHKPKVKPPTARPADALASTLTLAEALSSLGELDALRERELQWRQRALAAERELARFKRMFKSLGE